MGLGVALLALAALPAASAGATTTVGSDLSRAPNQSTGCSSWYSSCTFSQGELPSVETAAPAAGVIVRWRSRVSFSGSRSGTLRVLRPGQASYTAVAHSATVALRNGSVGSYETRIPVSAGDRIGLSGSFWSLTAFNNTATGASMRGFAPTLVDGAQGPGQSAPSGRELLVNADIEPDADADGFGDESQDRCPSDSRTQDECSADLQVTSTASTSGVGLLTELTFFVKVRNLGPQPAHAAGLTDRLGQLMRVDSVASDAGSCLGSPTVRCDLGTITPLQTVTIRIDATGVTRGTARTLATGFSATLDRNGANNSAEAETAVLNPGACGNTKNGGAAQDKLVGTPAGDSIMGGAGNDLLMGGVGYDCLYGGAGSDRLYGERSDDRLSGGAGNDALIGADGRDRLSGGPGDDTLRGEEGKDEFNGGAGNDSIDSRDGVAERVKCGRGRDGVVADRRDRLRSCEQRLRK